MLDFKNPAAILGMIAHGLAWVAFVWLAFWPYSYYGTETTPVGPDGSGGEVVSYSASIIDVNGLGIVIPLLVPVALTAAGFLIVLLVRGRPVKFMVLLWLMAVLMLAFCLLALLSIGVFYVPGALVLLVAALLFSLRSPRRQERY